MSIHKQVFNLLFKSHPTKGGTIKVLVSSSLDIELEQVVEVYGEYLVKLVVYPVQTDSKVYRSLTYLSSSREHLKGGTVDTVESIVLVKTQGLPDFLTEETKVVIDELEYSIQSYTKYLNFGYALGLSKC